MDTTVGALIEGGMRVTWSCQWCDSWGEVDLARIGRDKGWDYSMMDRLPLCTHGDCLGMLRFIGNQGMRSRILWTKAGKARFEAHTDWMFQTRQNAVRRAALLEARRARMMAAQSSEAQGSPV